MNSIGCCSESNVGAGIDQQSGAGGIVADRLDGIPGEQLEFASVHVFFTELDVIDTSTGSFRDFEEEMEAAPGFGAGKCAAIGDVVENRVGSHRSEERRVGKECR